MICRATRVRKQTSLCCAHSCCGHLHMLVIVHFLGPSRYSEEQSTLIKKLIGEGKTYKEVQNMIGCSAKMISNAFMWQPKPESLRENGKTTV